MAQKRARIKDAANDADTSWKYILLWLAECEANILEQAVDDKKPKIALSSHFMICERLRDMLGGTSRTLIVSSTEQVQKKLAAAVKAARKKIDAHLKARQNTEGSKNNAA